MENLIPVFEKNKYTNPELWEKLTHVDFEHMGLHAGSIAKFRRFMNRPEFQRGPSVPILSMTANFSKHICLYKKSFEKDFQ